MDYDVLRCTRQCARTGRDLAPGEEFFSVVLEQGTGLARLDFSREAWQGPPEGAIGWWKTQVPLPDANRPQRAPNDLMLEVFERLEGQSDRADYRYLLALLLLRRRVFRLEEQEHDALGREILVLFCPRRDATYRVPVVVPDQSRTELLQDELARLLFGEVEDGRDPRREPTDELRAARETGPPLTDEHEA
ncbi:MAG: hypothetical protein NUV77_02225 [Thermoguttaceae bacterium]|jgi:hypothetical protein|nr:hypothetical protein [Thermoguttaceae bacterium]